MHSVTGRIDSGQQPRRDRARQPYADVGRAMRQAIERALADPRLTLGHAKVLLVVLADVASWSRLDDATTRADLARRAGVSEETVKRAMHLLHEVGAVVWEPSTTRGRPSHVRLPRAVTVASSTDVEQAAAAPTTGHSGDPANGRTMGHPDDPPYEETYSEKKSEEVRAVLDALHEVFASVNSTQADRAVRTPEVQRAAQALVAAGKTPDDVRRGWAEEPPKAIRDGGYLGVTLLDRLTEGRTLQVRRPKRAGSRIAARSDVEHRAEVCPHIERLLNLDGYCPDCQATRRTAS